LLVLGDLSATSRKCVMDHLAECGSCLYRLSEAESFIAMFKELARRDSRSGAVSGRLVECADSSQRAHAAAV
jgi:hypothetical protein